MSDLAGTQRTPVEQVEKRIHLARGKKVLPIYDLAMLCNVLRGERTVRVNVAIMRAFAGLSLMQSANETQDRKLAELEQRLEGYDQTIRLLFDSIRQQTAQDGVNSEAAVLMRMNAVPRSIAAGLGETFAAAVQSESDLHSVRSARTYLRTLSPTDWQRAAPPNAKMSGEDYRSIWALLAGERG
jgi:hypothetical protein